MVKYCLPWCEKQTCTKHTQGWNQICLLRHCSSGSCPLADPHELQSRLQTAAWLFSGLNFLFTFTWMELKWIRTLAFGSVQQNHRNIFSSLGYSPVEICTCFWLLLTQIQISVVRCLLPESPAATWLLFPVAKTWGALIKCHTLIPVLSVLLSIPSIIPKGYESLVLSNSQKGIWTENTVVVYLLWIKHVIKVYGSTCASFERARFAVFLSIRKQDRIYKWFGEPGTSKEYLKNSFAHLHEVLNRLPPADTAAVISKNC